MTSFHILFVSHDFQWNIWHSVEQHTSNASMHNSNDATYSGQTFWQHCKSICVNILIFPGKYLMQVNHFVNILTLTNNTAMKLYRWTFNFCEAVWQHFWTEVLSLIPASSAAHCWIHQWKNYLNWRTFIKSYQKIQVGTFLWPTV